MKFNSIKLVFILLITVTLAASSVFITGFIKSDAGFYGSSKTFADFDDNKEENDEFGEDLEEDEDGIRVCPVCGYKCNPEDGLIFDELPQDWTCPSCGTPKSEFIDEDIKLTDPQAWLLHLRHVLEMRSKHLLVLQRVIDMHSSGNSLLFSISALQHALIASSKAVTKAQEAVDTYAALNNLTEDGMVNPEEEQEGQEEQGEEQIAGDNNGNKNGNGNNDKTSGKEKQEHQNNGNANGKNK